MARTAKISDEQKRDWSLYMQRRVMRLLLQHDRSEFHGKFYLFYTRSELPIHPVFQQYDRYLKLLTRCDELLEDIMPRIRLQLSLSTNSSRQRELAPTRGEIDWEHTIRTNVNTAPGLPPLLFETHLRQRDTSTLENLMTVAILLETRAELQGVHQEELGDEGLSMQELEILTGIDERVERELAAAYARLLIDDARQVELADLVIEVEQRLHPGPNPYRDLIAWWEQLKKLRIGRTREKDAEMEQALASERGDEKDKNFDADLYQLWIFLEFAHFLIDEKKLASEESEIDCDLATLQFHWDGRSFLLHYNRKNHASSSWENAPTVRPDYLIERVGALRVPRGASAGDAAWSEPAVALDAKYYTSASTHETLVADPIRKLLSDMALTYTPQVILFFPDLLLPETPETFKRAVRSKPTRYRVGWQQDQEIRLCELSPGKHIDEKIQPVLRAVLDHAAQRLPERTEPVCEGVLLHPATVNVNSWINPAYNAICPKRHIGPDVVDLVHTERHCLSDPRLCHVIGQAGVFPPRVISVSTRSELQEETRRLRTQYEILLRRDEAADEREQLCIRLLDNVGHMVEQYVARRGSTRVIEETFRNWIFHRYWDQEAWALAEETRKMLVSGEYVWYEYQESTLADWAAPAVQYCRALEYEVRRRLYQRNQARFVFRSRQVWTLGTLEYLYKNRVRGSRDDQQNWNLIVDCITHSAASLADFEAMLDRFVNERIVHKRNELAHGEPVAQPIAETLRQTILGDRTQVGILSWLVEHVEPI